MGKIVNLLEELRDRLQTEQSSGTLTEIKRIRVGEISEARLQNDFPIINLSLVSGSIEPSYIKAGHTAPCTFDIRIITNKLKNDSGNSLYKISDSTGIIFLLEKVINALDNNTSGNLDLGFNATAYNLRTYDYSISEDEDMIECALTLNLTTKQFIAGSL